MIPYNGLREANSEYKKGNAYDLVLSSKEDPWGNLDSIIEFVRRWNKRVSIGKNKEKIKKIVLGLQGKFSVFKNICIENFDFTRENENLIRSIFDDISRTALKFTGTSKLMHGINPDLFMMWDKGICIHYGVYWNSAGYINFMKLMQEEIKGLLKEHSKEEIIGNTNRSLPKLVDEYNWKHFSTSKSK